MKRTKADIILLIVTITWGTSFPLMKHVLDYIPTFAFLTLRYSLAFVIISVIFWRSFRKMDLKTIFYGFVLGFLLYGAMALQVAGLNYTTASNSGFITGLSILMVPILSTVIIKKKPEIDSILGIFLALIGFALLTRIFSQAFTINKGDFLTLCCTFFCAVYIILVDRYTNEKDPKALTVIHFFFASAFSGITWLLAGEGPVAFSWPAFNIIVFTAVFCTVFAFSAQMLVQKYTSPSHAALIYAAEPVFALVFALIIPNRHGVTETLEIVSVIGCVFILGGMIVSELKLLSRIRSKLQRRAGTTASGT